MALSGRLAGRDYLPEALAPGLLTIPWAVQAQSDPTDLTRPIADGLIALAWDVSARNAASISGAARVGETLTTRNPEFPDTHALRHAALARLGVPDDGAADAGIPDSTGTTCSRSDEDDGASINARVPFPDRRDRQETLSGGPVAYPVGPRQAPHDPQVEIGHPDLSVTSPPPVAGDGRRSCDTGRNRTESDPGRRAEAAWKRTAPTAPPPGCAHVTTPTTFPNQQPPAHTGLIRGNTHATRPIRAQDAPFASESPSQHA